MGRKVEFIIPDEWEDKWKRLLDLYGVSESELVLKLIEDEVMIMTAKSEREAYERMEKAAKMIYEAAGREGLETFAREIELIAKHIVEEVGK